MRAIRFEVVQIIRLVGHTRSSRASTRRLRISPTPEPRPSDTRPCSGAQKRKSRLKSALWDAMTGPPWMASTNSNAPNTCASINGIRRGLYRVSILRFPFAGVWYYGKPEPKMKPPCATQRYSDDRALVYNSRHLFPEEESCMRTLLRVSIPVEAGNACTPRMAPAPDHARPLIS
jgi:hypothetical protein